MEVILGVTGVDKIWLDESTDDEDSSEDPRALLPHTRRTLQVRRAGSTKSPQVTLARRPEETRVYTGGTQRAGPSRRELPLGCALIRQMGRQPRRGARHRPHFAP